MALLAQKNTTPPDGFVYHQFETQTRIATEGSGSLGDLVALVIAHRKWKGLTPTDPETVQLEVERQLCLGMPKGICNPEPGEDYRPFEDKYRDLTMEKIESFSAAAFAFLKSGMKYVDEAVSVPRGTICLGCRFNKAPGRCACGPLWEFLASMIPSSRRRGNLHVCGICGCTLQAKVLMPDEVIRESNAGRNFRFPDYCWQKGLA